MASKMSMTIKFEVKKFDGKSNFLLWKMWVTLLFVKEGTHKTLLSIEKKPSKMKHDEWNDIDFRAKSMIILCLSDEILYNVMNEETSLYMASLSNKLFMKKLLYSFRMKEGTPTSQYF